MKRGSGPALPPRRVSSSEMTPFMRLFGSLPGRSPTPSPSERPAPELTDREQHGEPTGDDARAPDRTQRLAIALLSHPLELGLGGIHLLPPRRVPPRELVACGMAGPQC